MINPDVVLLVKDVDVLHSKLPACAALSVCCSISVSCRRRRLLDSSVSFIKRTKTISHQNMEIDKTDDNEAIILLNASKVHITI